MFRVVTGTTNATATSSSDFTISGFGTPAGAIVYICSATSGSNPNTAPTSAINFLSMGYWDGTNQISKLEASSDAESSFTEAWKYSMSDKIGHVTNYAGTVQAEWSISNITDGVRITTDVSNSDSLQCMVVLIPSAGISNIKCFNADWSGHSSSAITVSTVGFEADLVFSMCGVNPGVDNVDDSVQTGWGFTHNVDGSDANIVQMSSGMTINHGRDLGATTTWTATGSWDYYGCINFSNNGGIRYGIRFTSFGASGWTMTKYDDEDVDPPTTLTSATFALEEDTMHMAIKFTGSPDIKVFQPNAPNATGSWSTTTPGFQPTFGMLLCPRNEQVINNNAGTGDQQGICAFDSSTQATIGILDQDNVNTSWCSAFLDTGGIQCYEDQNSSVYDASFTSFDANGWTWSFSTVTDTSHADPWVALALGPAIAPITIEVPLGPLR